MTDEATVIDSCPTCGRSASVIDKVLEVEGRILELHRLRFGPWAIADLLQQDGIPGPDGPVRGWSTETVLRFLRKAQQGTPVEALGLRGQPYNRLIDLGLTTIEELESWGGGLGLPEIRNLGPKGRAEVTAALERWRKRPDD